MVALSTPNLYQLHGHHLHITYSTSSIDGKPRFQYHDPFQTLQFSGDQIRTLLNINTLQILVNASANIGFGFHTVDICGGGVFLECVVAKYDCGWGTQ